MSEAGVVQTINMETAKKKAATYKHQPITATQERVTQVATLFSFSRDNRTLGISYKMYQYLNVGKWKI